MMLRPTVALAPLLLALTFVLCACDEDSSATQPNSTAAQTGGDTGAAAEPSTGSTEQGSGEGTASTQPAGTPGAAPSGSPASGSEPPGKTKGAERGTAAYGAWLQSAGRYTAGKAATVQAVLKAKGDYKCNEKYPYKFKLDAPSPGVSYPKRTVRGIEYGKERSVMSIPFTPSQPGRATVAGTFYVSVCTKSTCKMGREKLSVTVTVHDGG